MRWATFEERIDVAARLNGLPRIAPCSLRQIADLVRGTPVAARDGVEWLVLDSRAICAAVRVIREEMGHGPV